MRKFISLFLVATLVCSYSVAFAENETASSQPTQDITQENTTVSTTDNQTSSETQTEQQNSEKLKDNTTNGDTIQPEPATETGNTTSTENQEQINTEAEKITDIDESDIKVQEDQIVNNIENGEITKQNINQNIKQLYTYLRLRDVYYKRVLAATNRIKAIKNPGLKKQAVLKLEQKLESQKEKDKLVYEKIEKSLAFIKENKDNTNKVQKLAYFKVVKPLLQKYQKHRIMVRYIYRTIDELKKTSFKQDISKLVQMAEKSKESGDKIKALEYLKQAAATGAADQNTFKKLGQLLKETEGKGPKVLVKGVIPNFDVKPIIKDGRTMVPFRAIAESLKANVEWDDQNRAVVLTKGAKRVVIPIDKKYIEVNGEKQEVDVPATIVDERTLVPARVVSEALDTTVTWDEETEVVKIEDNITEAISDITAEDLKEAGVEDADSVVTTVDEKEIINELNSVDETADFKNIIGQ